MFLLLAGISISIVYVYFRLKYWELMKYAKEIPGFRALPIIGNANKMMGKSNMSEVWLTIKEIAEKFSDYGIMKFWAGPILSVAIWDPAFIEVVANSPLTVKKSKAYNLVFGTKFNGVVVIPGGPRWKELRKPLTKSMSKRYLENEYLSVFVRRSKGFRDFLMEKRVGKYMDAMSDCSALMLDIFSETHLGVPLNEVKERRWNFYHTLDEFIDLTVSAILNYHFHIWRLLVQFTSQGAKLEVNGKKIMTFMKWILGERQKSNPRKTDDMEFYPDFLLRRASEKNIHSEDLWLELTDVVGAGSDTSSVLLSTAILFLAMFPEIQEEAYREQVAIFGDSDRDPTIVDLADMTYLNRVVKETLRHVSPPGVLKSCEGNVKMGKYTLPEGTDIFIFMHKVHHDPKYWEKPNSFYPDHFLPQKEAARPKYSFVPFGVGPRSCIGFQYGTNSTLIILSTVLRSLRITTDMKYEDIVYDYKLMLSIKNGYPVQYVRR